MKYLIYDTKRMHYWLELGEGNTADIALAHRFTAQQLWGEYNLLMLPAPEEIVVIASRGVRDRVMQALDEIQHHADINGRYSASDAIMHAKSVLNNIFNEWEREQS